MQTIKQQAASQRRSLKAIKAKLTAMSADWGDVDCYFQSRLDGVAQEVEKLEREMTGFTNEGGNDDNS